MGSDGGLVEIMHMSAMSNKCALFILASAFVPGQIPKSTISRGSDPPSGCGGTLLFLEGFSSSKRP